MMGNNDGFTESRQDIKPPMEGRYIRLYPRTYVEQPALRWELYG